MACTATARDYRAAARNQQCTRGTRPAATWCSRPGDDNDDDDGELVAVDGGPAARSAAVAAGRRGGRDGRGEAADAATGTPRAMAASPGSSWTRCGVAHE